MKYRHLIALTALLTHTAHGALSAPMPAFKTASQLATWRAEMAAKPTSHGDSAEDPAFFTGKPYIDASGGYAFKYRSYSPELARWTSEDPSGFPDGANQFVFAPCPTSEYDPNGLESQAINETLAVSKILSFVNDKLTLYGANWADGLLAQVAAVAVTQTADLLPKYVGQYQWNTTGHKMVAQENPGQTGLSQCNLSAGGVGINVSVTFKTFTPDAELELNPATSTKQYHYKAEGYWMLSMSGTIGGSWEVERSASAKVDTWCE